MKFLVVLLLTGCVAQGVKETVPPPGCHAPAVALAVSTAKIDELKGRDPKFDLRSRSRTIHIGAARAHLADQTKDWNDMYGYGPVLWVTEGKSVRTLDLRSKLPSATVAAAYADSDLTHVFLFLETGIEGPAPEYKVWISLDRGEHWFAGADLKRPPGVFPPASLDSFFLTPAGVGNAWLKLDASNLANRGAIPADSDAYFRAITPDCGLSWDVTNSPAFASVVHRADAVAE